MSTTASAENGFRRQRLDNDVGVVDDVDVDDVDIVDADVDVSVNFRRRRRRRRPQSRG